MLLLISMECYWYIVFHCMYIPQFLYPAAAKSLQSCPTLCDPIDGSPPGSPVPGILQERTLEWVAISFSNARKWKVKVRLLSVSNSSQPHGLQPIRFLRPWDFPGKSAGVGCQHLGSPNPFPLHPGKRDVQNGKSHKSIEETELKGKKNNICFP